MQPKGTMDIHSTILDIKKSLRLSMNGVVSTLQRRQGLDYKINFGVEIPRIKSIASEYEQNRELSLALWKENIRECRILAIFIMPADEFTAEDARKWIDTVSYTELADHLSMNLLCNIPGAATLATECLKESAMLSLYCGYMTLSHLLRRGITLSEDEEKNFLQAADKVLAADNCSSVIQRCAYNAVSKYIDNDTERNHPIAMHYGNIKHFFR